jgi:hypothetical protein
VTTGEIAVLVQALASSYMAGVVWYAQVVHYPLFAKVPAAEFPPYQQQNVGRTAMVVIPPMLAELGAAAVLLWDRPPAVPRWATVVGAVLVLVIWLVTALVQAPSHARLARRFDPALHRFTVRTNWIRTATWTARALLAGYVVACA